MMIIEFAVFVFLQSLFINGVHLAMKYECTEDIKRGRLCNGLLLYPIAKWVDDNVKGFEWLKKPLYKCIRCMASFWGGVSFWGYCLMFIGLDWRELPVYMFDVFILVILNFYIYKKI